jgi:hypothetical protein
MTKMVLDRVTYGASTWCLLLIFFLSFLQFWYCFFALL